MLSSASGAWAANVRDGRERERGRGRGSSGRGSSGGGSWRSAGGGGGDGGDEATAFETAGSGGTGRDERRAGGGCPSAGGVGPGIEVLAAPGDLLVVVRACPELRELVICGDPDKRVARAPLGVRYRMILFYTAAGFGYGVYNISR